VDTAVFGREAELVEVAATLEGARHGFTALVLEGDPGIGKTTVWRTGIASAAGRGYRVLSCRAVQAEARLSFAALGDLLAPVEPEAFDALPVPQRRALDAALLRADAGGAAPNPRAIGTAIVTLLSALAALSPVVVAVDDIQWLDLPSARALEFAFRRLEARSVAVLATLRLGVRSSGSGLLASGASDRIRALRLGPLSLAALYRIVEERLGRKLPRPLLVKIERVCGGNAFFALEIARALPPSGSPAGGEELPIPGDLSQLVADRLRKLPQRTRDALLRVSALPQPTLAVVDAAALAPAEEAGVVRTGADGRIELAHPLFASAIHASASRERRRRLHAELAETATDVEERARHLLLASAPEQDDERVAAVLHAAAEHALRRGAVEVAAELAEQSARLTPAAQADLRWQRQLRATRHHLKAGDPRRSRALCEAVLGSAPGAAVRAEALHLLAEAQISERPAGAIPLLEEALVCAGDDFVRAAQLEVALGMVHSSLFDLAESFRHLGGAIELAERAGDSALLAEALAMNEVARIVSGNGFDERALERALALEDVEREVLFQMRPSFNAAAAYEYVGRVDVARPLLVKLRERLVARGEEADLPWALINLAVTSYLAGAFERAEQEASEAERTAALTGGEIFRAFALMVRGLVRGVRGNASGAHADAVEALASSERLGWRKGVADARFALGLLALSEGDPAAAVDVLEPLLTWIEAAGVYEWPIAMAVPDAIEALVATGALERATRLTQALGDSGRRFDRPWALATSGRCEALLAAAAGDLDRALAAAERALVAHERLPMPFERARTLLVKGQLQRRHGERRAGRATLSQALASFEELGAPLWAERARAEIARIGVRRAPAELTESETRVAELATEGLTNPEIAARLFMSRRTVEANLARAYRKLDIRSRAELGATMAKRETATRS